MNQSQHDEPVAPERVRRLRRSRNGTVGGVATGLAGFLGTEVLLLQIAFVLLSLFTGAGVLLYAAGWLALPQEDDPDPRPLALNDNPLAAVAGILLAMLGFLAMGQGIVWGPNVFIPVAMILAGAWILNQRAEAASRGPIPSPAPGEPARVAPPPPAPRPPATPPAPPPPATPPAPTSPIPPNPAATNPPPAQPHPPQPTWRPPPRPTWHTSPLAGARPATTHAPRAPGSHWAQARLDQPEPEPHRGSTVTTVTMAVTAVVVGTLLVIRNVGNAELGATVFVGSVVAVLGAGIVASAFLSRSLPLIFLSLLGVVALVMAPMIDATMGGGLGTRRAEISAERGLAEPSYSLGAGEMIIDLRGLDPNLDHEVEVSLGAGPAQIIVDHDMEVEATATNRAGYLDILGVVDEGVFNDVSIVSPGRDPASSSGRLKLTIEVTFGYGEVIRRG
jgi:phage shock protein PspC (stress-responsive transcriptional regulator)